jgi:hypothetical protein
VFVYQMDSYHYWERVLGRNDFVAWQQGRRELFYPCGKTYLQTLGELTVILPSSAIGQKKELRK